MTALSYEDLPLTQSLSAKARTQLRGLLKKKTYQNGTLIMQEGDPAESLLLLLQGQADILLDAGMPHERQLGQRKTGSFIGEMGLFTPKGQRTADVRANGDVIALILMYQDLQNLMINQPEVAFELLRTITQRLKAADDQAIAELRQKNVELKKAYTDLAAAQAALVEKERLEKELEVARRIQFSILPSTRPEIPGFSVGACIQPARAVGGDLFDFFELPDGCLGISVGDVSDKGVPAAIFMARYCSLLRAVSGRGFSPVETLERVNALLIQRNEPGMFVTVIYGILDPAKRTFNYARAGHELPLLFDSEGTLEKISHGLGQPLGIFEDAVMDPGEIQLPPNTTLLFNSDGASDATNPDGAYYGVPQLIESIQSRLGLEAQPLCDSLLEALNAYRQDSAQFDDITLVAIHAQPK